MCGLGKPPDFDGDSIALQPASLDLIDAMAVCLQQGAQAQATVRVIGRAASGASGAEGLLRALQRAEAVARYLEARGIPRSRMDVIGTAEADAGGLVDVRLVR